MPLPSQINSTNQRIDTIYGPDGTPLYKLAVGMRTVGGEDAGWQAVASHVDAEAGAFESGDGMLVAGGVDRVDDTPRAFLVDTEARLVVSLTPAYGNLTDYSGIIAAGGTAQSLTVANPIRKYLLIQNTSSADLWINFGADATAISPSIKLAAGERWESNTFVPTQSVSIIGATLGQTFTAKEG